MGSWRAVSLEPFVLLFPEDFLSQFNAVYAGVQHDDLYGPVTAWTFSVSVTLLFSEPSGMLTTRKLSEGRQPPGNVLLGYHKYISQVRFCGVGHSSNIRHHSIFQYHTGADKLDCIWDILPVTTYKETWSRSASTCSNNFGGWKLTVDSLIMQSACIIRRYLLVVGAPWDYGM